MRIRNLLIAGLAVGIAAQAAKKDETDRLNASAEVLKEMATQSDKGVPKELFDKAACAVIVPSLKKGGFILAGKFGRGFATCRTKTGWSAPSGVKVEGGSIGFQAGGSESDVILLVMNQSGMNRLLQSKFTLGGEASVAAGPLGRDSSAQTDATMRAEILSYSRSRGVFGGLAIQGATLRPDEDANVALYGKGVEPKAILSGEAKAPEGSGAFMTQIRRFSGSSGKAVKKS